MNYSVPILAVSIIVIGYMTLRSKSYYSSTNHPILNVVREKFRRIKPEYADIPLKEGSSAYTENKSVITLCLKDPETEKYYDMNTITYVALHELAHMVSKTHGHNDEFKENFSLLLARAAKLGIYDPMKPIPFTYCGVNSE